MNSITEEQFNLAVESVIDDVAKLFNKKNTTYKTDKDPLANFTNGGLLRHHDGTMKGRYEALKDYVAKHIVNAYEHDIDFPQLEESTLDIAVYFVIATAMARLNVKQRCGDCDNFSALNSQCGNCSVFSTKVNKNEGDACNSFEKGEKTDE